MLAFGFPIFDDLIFCQLQGARNPLANEDYINDTVWTYLLYIDITHNSRQLLPTLYNIGVLTLDYILYKHQRRCVPKPNRAIFFAEMWHSLMVPTDHKDHYAACMYKMWLAIKPVGSAGRLSKSSGKIKKHASAISGGRHLWHPAPFFGDATWRDGWNGNTSPSRGASILASNANVKQSSSHLRQLEIKQKTNKNKSKTCKQITESIVETNLHCCIIIYIYI